MQKKTYTLAYFQKDRKTNYALNAFLYTLILSVLVLIPVLYFDNGYFLYYGDFNVQQIPFYRLAHDSILSGNVKWSYLTDLGSNFIGSYSFYLLGSPFFYITLLFPSNMVAYLIGPLLILKLSLCSLSAYIFLRRYVINKDLAVMGGILYAFSGFSVYNIFFFHFHEPMIILPLMLAALDEFMAVKRRGVMALCVFTAAFVNYYFFFGEVVFVAIYFVIKTVSHSYELKLKEMLILAFECIIGVLMSCILLIPSILAIMSNSRISSMLTGYDALLYTPSQRYMHILSSLFFPPDIPARPNFTPDSSAKWASVAAFLPLFSMTFVISYIKTRRKSWVKRLFILLIVMAFIPLLNSMFQAFNSVFYTRWFYMLTLIMILMTVISLENFSTSEFKSSFIWTVFFTLAIAIPIGVLPVVRNTDSPYPIYDYGLEDYPVKFWIYVGIALGGLITLAVIVYFTSKKPKMMIRALTIALCIISVGYTEFIIWSGKAEGDQSDDFILQYALNYGEDVTLEDVHEVRSDFDNTMDNIAMYWQVPTINAFHSIVPSSIMDFYSTLGVERLVASRPDIDLYGIRALLSVKYYFLGNEKNSTESKSEFNSLPGFEYINTENGYDEYENKYYIPMGFMYDNFICEEEFNNLSQDVKHLAMLKAMVLTQDQIEKYRDITGYTEGMFTGLTYNPKKPQNIHYPVYDGYKPVTDSFKYTTDEYFKDCEKLKSACCESFSYDNNGFSAVIDNKGDDNLLFFSVPYDEGFTAYVNGEETEIEKVNIGFCAVKVDGHTKSEIRFNYTTPGLSAGIYVSIVSAVVFVIYMIICRGFKPKKKFRKKYTVKK